MVAMAATLVMVVGTANAASAAPESPANAMRLVVTGTSFGLAEGESKTVEVLGTPTSRGGSATAAGDRAARVAASCHLGGELPHLIDFEGSQRRLNFTASLRCDGVSGQVQLTVGLQQRLPMGGYINDKFSGPYPNPTPLIILGVSSDPKPCVEISLGAWRGVAHPVLITDAVVYDFGWYPTYDASLAC